MAHDARDTRGGQSCAHNRSITLKMRSRAASGYRSSRPSYPDAVVLTRGRTAASCAQHNPPRPTRDHLTQAAGSTALRPTPPTTISAGSGVWCLCRSPSLISSSPTMLHPATATRGMISRISRPPLAQRQSRLPRRRRPGYRQVLLEESDSHILWR